MAKALVIKNASFLTNKLTTVTFNDVACTGVSFSQSSVSFDSLGEAEIEYEITPSNTTDEVLFSSSDSTVVDFSDGIAIVNGIGTCTLSIICGQYTATCSITVDIYENPVLFGGFASEKTNSVTSNGGIRIDTISSKGYLNCIDEVSKGYFSQAISVRGTLYDGIGPITAIKIPENANVIHFSVHDTYNSGANIFFTNAEDTFDDSGYTYVEYNSKQSLTIQRNSSAGYDYIEQDIAVPAGVHGYVISIRPAGTIVTDFNAITTEADMKSFVATNMGLSIHYLHSDAPASE